MSDRHATPRPIRPEPPARRAAGWRRWLLRGSVAVIALGGVAVLADWWRCLPDEAQATYVGRESCLECHRPEYELWQGSHHDLAMDRATPDTVLGDFDNAELEVFGVRSRMFRQGEKFLVHTEGPDGKLADFQVKYVFGVTPLQNYLVEFDRPADMPDHEIARLQVLRITWDTLGKRWFYLPPPDVRDQKLAPDDDLHWTGMAQRWNNMCADCHSTNLQRNYDVATGIYHTTFSEIDVSCEACHGRASLHVQLARRRSLFWDRKRGYGLARLKDNQKAQLETCAPCHSRRGIIYPGFQPGDDYHDYFANELLRRETYHADGQIQDEDYEYGSFLQSKMYHKGIKCSDCHDPHSMRVRHEGNAVCTTCHQHPAGKYDSPAHHFHQPDSPGASCTACHMPKTTYMEVDPRLDHSIRIPRPDLSITLGTPNACTWCHVDRDKDPAAWRDRRDLTQYLDWVLAARRGDQPVRAELARIDGLMLTAVRQWYGEKTREPDGRKQHFAYALDAAHRGALEAEEQLVPLVTDGRVPAIVRATAAAELGQFGGDRVTLALQTALSDPDPQVRAAAVSNLAGRLPEDRLVRCVSPLLDDRIRAVRIEAARVLAGVAQGTLRGAQRQQLQAAIEELQAGLRANNDRAGSHLALGSLYETLGDTTAAMAAYRDAMRVEPRVTGPRTNLAALCDRLADEADARARQVEQRQQETARAKATEQAAEYRREAAALRLQELDFLARDVRLLPTSAALQYRYGMLLYLHRQMEAAEQALAAAVSLEPSNPQFLLGLVLFYREQQRPQQALPWAEKLVRLRPDDPMYRQVLDEVRQAAATPR